MTKKIYTPAQLQVTEDLCDIICSSLSGTSSVSVENDPSKKANPIWGVL